MAIEQLLSPLRTVAGVAFRSVDWVLAAKFGVEAGKMVRERAPFRLAPDNHDFILGLRTAQLQAAKAATEAWYQGPGKEEVERSHDAGRFLSDVRRFIQPKLLFEMGVRPDEFLRIYGGRPADLRHVRESLDPALEGTVLDAPASSARAEDTPDPGETTTAALPSLDPPDPRTPPEAAARVTLDELREAARIRRGKVPLAAVVVPESFEEMFLDPDPKGKGWYGWFSLFVGEQLKKNEEFRSALFADEFRKVKSRFDTFMAAYDERVEVRNGRLAELQDSVEGLTETFSAFAEVQLTLQQQMRRLIDKVESMRGDLRQVRRSTDSIGGKLDSMHADVGRGFEDLGERVSAADREAKEERARLFVQLQNLGKLEDPSRPRGAPDRPLSLWQPAVSPASAAPEASAASEEGTADSLVYRRALDRFMGRERSWKLAREFLQTDGEERFRYTVVHGPAGTGKSRFAMEVLRAAADAYPYQGFIERSGVGLEKALIPDGAALEAWTPTEPTLVVVDYCARYPNLLDFLRLMHAAAGRSGVPLRVMLLERYMEGELSERLSGVGAEDRWLRVSRIPEAIPLAEDPLGADELLQIILGRLDPELRQELDPDELLRRLGDLDPDRRPLFAAILGGAVAHGLDMRSAPDSFKLDLFREFLRREEEKAWFGQEYLPAADRQTVEPWMRTHKNLLALSTMCQGLEVEDLDDLEGAPFLPDFSRDGRIPWDRSLLRRMTGQEPLDRIDFLEPDLLGELFVLDHLATLPRMKDGRKGLLDAAWRLAPDEVGAFVRQCFQDYPELVARLDYLRPGSRDLWDAWMPVGRTLVHDCRLRCTDGNPSPDDLEPWIGYATSLLEEMKQVHAATGGDEEAGAGVRHLAAAARYRLELLGASLSEEIRKTVRHGLAAPAERFRTIEVKRTLSDLHGLAAGGRRT